MEEANTQAAPEAAAKSAHEESSAAGSGPVIHRVCEACNNMFASHPGSKHQRCPKCTKE